MKAHAKYVLFYISFFSLSFWSKLIWRPISISFFFCSDTLYVLISFSIEGLLAFDKFCENFSLGSSLNQSQTYQGNPCGIYLDLSFLSGSGVNPNSVTCIKLSAPSKDHIRSLDDRRRRYITQMVIFIANNRIYSEGVQSAF